MHFHRAIACCILFLGSITANAQPMSILETFDVPHLLAYLVAAFIIMIFILIFTNRIYYFQEQEVINRSRQINAQLALIQESNKTQIWLYDIQLRLFMTFAEQGSKGERYTSFDFSQQYNYEDFVEMKKTIKAIAQEEKFSELVPVRGAAPKDGHTRQKVYSVNLSILRRDKHNHPTMLLGIQQDVTKEKEKEDFDHRLMLRYHTVFNSSLVDLVYYDADGYISDINDKACRTFRIASRAALLRRRVHLTDLPTYRNMDIREIDHMFFSAIVDIGEAKARDERVPECLISGMFYYEVSVKAVRDKNGVLKGFLTSGHDITEMVEAHHRERKASEQLRLKNSSLQNYISNINYSLKVSNVQLMNYHPDTHELEFFSDLSKARYRLTQIRCQPLLHIEERHKAHGLFRRMDRRQAGTFTETLRTILRDRQGRNIYLNFHIMPIYAADRRLTHYFGMCRNDTESTYTDLHLRRESAKAQETELLKNTFLQNMNYELRTPLNAVIGFAQLYNGEHSPEDEPVFAAEIKKNTNQLLQLINDILFISRLDAHMIEFNYQESDFATLFDSWCYMGWSILPPQVKAIVENPYSHLFVRIDPQNLGMAIQKLCASLARTMKEGTVKAKYEYRHGELAITIENTGKGFTPEIRERVFERFSRDTLDGQTVASLDLPIVKELTEQMGGNIELQSEADRGNSFYITLPCEIINLEKKFEITV